MRRLRQREDRPSLKLLVSDPNDGKYDRSMGPPVRITRLPEQYFGALLTRVAAAAHINRTPVIDLGRGNPETGPPAHVVERLTRSARRPNVHGYSPFRGLSALRDALAERYRTRYGVELDPDSEVAVVPGTKTAI